MGREWRFVVVMGEVVAASRYQSDERTGLNEPPPQAALAAEIGANVELPDAAYVMDIGFADDKLRLLELNPISGADLYDCHLTSVCAAIGGLFP